MSKFEKINVNFFTAFFALVAVLEFIGFLTGRLWCLYAAILSAAVAIIIYRAAKHESKAFKNSKQ